MASCGVENPICRDPSNADVHSSSCATTPGAGMNELWHRMTRCFFEPHARLGWMLVGIGLFAWSVFGRHADWPALVHFRAPLQRTHGTVVKRVSSGFTVGDTPGVPIHAVQFTFVDPGGAPRNGTSWSDHASLRPGDQVDVEFVVRDPNRARIVGWRSRPLPVWAGAVVLFPLFGVSCLVKVIRGRVPQSASGRVQAVTTRSVERRASTSEQGVDQSDAAGGR